MSYLFDAVARSGAAPVEMKAPYALHFTLFLDVLARRFKLVIPADVLFDRQHAFVRRDGMRHLRIAHNHFEHADHRRTMLHACPREKKLVIMSLQ